MATTSELATTLKPATVVSAHLRTRTSARRLADQACEAAMDAAGIRAEDVDLLLNAGLYRDRNLGEPALAALIQEDVGSNPEDPHTGAHGTFSFDVANGACGVLSALQIADGFLQAGTIRHALVVASDADPGHHMAPAFPFSATGAAIVCGRGDGTYGLAGFAWERSVDDTFRSRVAFDGRRNLLRVEKDPDFAERAAVVAAKAAGAVLADHGLHVADIDLIVANPLMPPFLATLASYLGCPSERFVVVDGAEQVHTAGLLVGLATAQDQGRLAEASRTLLVSAGAGIVAGAALVMGV